MLLLNNNLISQLMSNYREGDVELFLQVILISLFVLFFYTGTNAQWSNNAEHNKRLVIDTKNPMNISTADDFSGGGFIFWEEKRDSNKTNIYFQHFDEEAEVSFRADGKPVSRLNAQKGSSVSSPFERNAALVLWKDHTYDKAGELFVQKVSASGLRQWSEDGLRLTFRQGEESEYSLSSDGNGNAFIIYLNKDYSLPENYSIFIQKVNSYGRPGFKENGILIYKSPKLKSRLQVLADSKGGAYIFWVESTDNKGQLFSLHIDPSGNTDWGKKPVQISGPQDDVFNYTALRAGNSAYLAWETKKGEKDIYHQLISISGKLQWNKWGERITGRYGNQTNPQGFYSDSLITISWLNETFNDKDVFIQRFNLKGKPQWSREGVEVIRTMGNQISQKVLSDRSSGAYIAWVDKRTGFLKGNIMGQRISKNGRKMWDSLGVAIGTNNNSEKSYLSLLPNKSNGFIGVFKDIRPGFTGIYGQRLLGSGRYTLEATGFYANLVDGVISAAWQSSDEENLNGFYIERATASDTLWQRVKFIPAKKKKGNNSYEYSERLSSQGNIFYRLVVADMDNNMQKSAPVKVNRYKIDYNNISLFQNFPNPFSDSTEIKYFLPERTKVVLEVYTDKIETICELVNDIQEKGEYTVVFNPSLLGRRLPSGVYFYRLKADQFVDVKKMIISR